MGEGRDAGDPAGAEDHRGVGTQGAGGAVPAVATGWAITFEGNIWRDGDLTVGEALDACLLAGGGWESLDPYAHPAALVGLLVAFLANRTGEDAAVALQRVRALSVDALMACLVAVA